MDVDILEAAPHLGAAPRRSDGIALALEKIDEQSANLLLVVDNENAALHGCRHDRGPAWRGRMPRPILQSVTQ